MSTIIDNEGKITRPHGGHRHGTRGGTVVVSARVSRDERAAIDAAAERAGMTVAEWARRAVVEAATRADHARLVAAHLEAVGGMPGATP